MQVVFNENEKIIAVAPILYQIDETRNFYPAAIAVTEKGFVIFSDYAPSSIDGDEYHYNPVKHIDFKDIHTVVLEKLRKNADLSPYGRLNILTKNIDNSEYIYFDLSYKDRIDRFLIAVESLGHRVDKRKVDCSPII